MCRRSAGTLRHALFFAAALTLVLLSSRGVYAGQDQPQPPASGAQSPAPEEERSSPWMLVPMVSSNPKLGTSGGALAAYLHEFDPESRVSIFGVSYQYTSTHSSVAAAFARVSSGADHHRIVGLGVFGYIKNDYDDYLGSGQPLKTDDDLKALAGRYLYRVKGNWFLGGQGTAANYQIFGQSPEDDLTLDTLGLVGFKSVALGAVVMHDSRDNEDMPTRGWFLNVNNKAYREGLGGEASFDSYRSDLKVIWPQRGGHLMAFRQFNWLTYDAPSVAEATIMLRGYKQGEYLAPFMSSFEAEERLAFGTRWTATLFVGVADLYGDRSLPATTATARQYFPNWGAGIQFVIKPAKRMLMNFEYAGGVEDNRGGYLKFGYGW